MDDNGVYFFFEIGNILLFIFYKVIGVDISLFVEWGGNFFLNSLLKWIV